MPRTLSQVIAEIRAGRAILPLARRAEMSDSRWHQIEGGDIPPVETLWKMATVLDADPSQLRELFHAAGYGEMFTKLTAIGARGRPDVPPAADMGVLADPDLSSDDKNAIIEFIRFRKSLRDAAMHPREAAE